MTTGREGTAGILPAQAPVVREIPAAHSGLSVAAAARSEPFFVSGERCMARGLQSRDGVDVRFDSGAIVRIRPSNGTAANLVAFPGLLRREFVGPAGSVSETVLCAPSIPMAVTQWSGDGRPSVVDVTCEDGRGPGPDGGQEVSTLLERTGFGATLRLDDERYLVVLASPEPTGIEVDAGRGSVRIQAGEGAVLSVIIGAGSRADVTRVVKAAPHLSGHLLRATAGPESDGLYVDSGVPEIDDGVAWARSRLRSFLPVRSSTPGEVFRYGVAALATGDEEVAREAFARLDDGDPRLAFLAGRMSLSLGDAGPVTATAEALLSSPESWTPTDPWHRGALDSLAAGLHNSAPELVDALRGLRARSPSPDGGGRRLPVVGAPAPPPGEAERLWSLLGGFEGVESALVQGDGADVRVDGAGARGDGADARAFEGPSPDPSTLLTVIAPLFRSDPDAAWRSWREILAAGLDAGPMGPATWDAEPGRGSAAADLLLTLVHGCLGIGPDAPSGRLRIAPRLPHHLTRLSFGGIRIGAARMRLNIERDAGVDRYEFVPEFAGVPPLLVFEPAMEGPVEEVRIDGDPAALDRRTEHGRTVVPVQLPLDGIRVVEVCSAPHPAPAAPRG